jgi:hypothetical protein
MFARVLSLLAVLIWPIAAGAAEVNLSIDTSGQYDTNITRQDGGDENDISFRVGPRIRIQDRKSNLVYRLDYRPIYEIFVQNTDLNEHSHLVNGEVLWNIGDRTSVLLQDTFSYTQSINEGNLVAEESVTGEPIQETPNSEIVRSNVFQNSATMLWRHNFTPRTTGQLNISHDFFDSDSSNSLSSSTLAGTTSVTHAITARDRIGIGGGVNWQQYEENSFQPGSDTFTYRAFFSWLHKFGENTELSIQGGPALIMTNQDSPDPEVLVQEVPHHVVTTGGTADDVYDSLGLNTPSDLTDINDVPLTGSTMIPAGSILVTDTVDCSQGSIGAGTLVFVEPNCGLKDVALAGTHDVFIADLTLGDILLMFPMGTDPGKTRDSTVTYFGAASLTHQWLPNLKSELSYSRSDSSASSLGSATVADQVTFLTSWEATNRLDLRFRADWLKRTSPVEVTNSFREIEPMPVLGRTRQTIFHTGDLVTQTSDRSVDTQYWSVSARAAYRFNRQITLTGRTTYQNQDTKRASTSSNSTFQNVIVFFGVRYDFDPFRF